MKKLAFLILLFVVACGPLVPTPNDFPTPPTTIIIEFPNYTATPVFFPIPQPITSDDMMNASSFLLILKTNMAAGNDEGIAERVLYPIDVKVNGKPMTLNSPPEFIKNYKQIFNDKILAVLTEADTEALIPGPQGVRVGNGELWFNLFCLDAACSQKEFLITQINN